MDFGLAPPGSQVVDVVWLDVNSRIATNGKPDLLPNIQAINNSLFNLFATPIGTRGPIFQPEYGTGLYHILHEPLDLITSNKIKIVLIQAIQRWEPRIELDLNRTTVAPDYERAAFIVQVSYNLVGLRDNETATFLLKRP
jgi:phage baseplate assembly protein W